MELVEAEIHARRDVSSRERDVALLGVAASRRQGEPRAFDAFETTMRTLALSLLGGLEHPLPRLVERASDERLEGAHAPLAVAVDALDRRRRRLLEQLRGQQRRTQARPGAPEAPPRGAWRGAPELRGQQRRDPRLG